MWVLSEEAKIKEIEEQHTWEVKVREEAALAALDALMCVPVWFLLCNSIGKRRHCAECGCVFSKQRLFWMVLVARKSVRSAALDLKH
eukprot:3301898-Amphidinium_carterae.1